MPPPIFVTTVAIELAEKIKHDLLSQGFELGPLPHGFFIGKKQGISVAFYQSGKFTVQGSQIEEFIRFYLEPEILGTVSYGYEKEYLDKHPRMGSDEAGKGDFFGPLVVACVGATEEQIIALFEIGVKDSKSLSDEQVKKLAAKIKTTAAYDVMKLLPEKYNELYTSFGNLNHLLAWAHGKVVETVHKKTHFSKIIIDKFADEHLMRRVFSRLHLSLDLEMRVKAESDVVVAAASILARSEFLHSLENLSQQIGIQLPKGSSNGVKSVGLQIARKDITLLKKVSKTHFKTFQEIEEALCS